MVVTDKRGQSVWSCSWLHNYRYIKSGSQVKRKKNSKTTPSCQFLSPIQIIPSIHRMRDMVLPGEVAMLLQALHTETDNHSRPTSSFCGEKLEYLQRTHTDARKTCKRHRERPPGGPRVASDLNIGPSFCETTVKSTITLPPPSNSALNKCLFRLVSRSLLSFFTTSDRKTKPCVYRFIKWL